MSGVVDRLGVKAGLVVQELGWDNDVDEDLRGAIEDELDADMIEDAVEAVDMVLLWWRDDDGDLIDGMVDSLTDLGGQGVIWLMTPKVGRPGYVDPADIAEAAVTAGLSLTSTATVSSDWAASKLVRPKSGHR